MSNVESAPRAKGRRKIANTNAKPIPAEALPRDAQSWAAHINGKMSKSVAAIIETGQAFIDAKEALGHGNYLRMFRGETDAVERPVICGVRSAQRLVDIARNTVLSNATHASHLPSSWMTLYELTTIPNDGLEAAIDERWVHPEMERADVKGVKERLGLIEPRAPRGSNGGGRKSKKDPDDDEPRDGEVLPPSRFYITDKCEEFIRDIIFTLSDDEAEDMLSSLRLMLRSIENDLNHKRAQRNNGIIQA